MGIVLNIAGYGIGMGIAFMSLAPLIWMANQVRSLNVYLGLGALFIGFCLTAIFFALIFKFLLYRE